MQRLTARLLLLFALAGNFLPFALAATSASPHACCIRKSAHPCHSSAETQGLSIGSRSCCSQDCSRAVTTSQSAQPRSPIAALAQLTVSASVADQDHVASLAEFLASRSARAPPQLSIA
jgi:hypothetical protein